MRRVLPSLLALGLLVAGCPRQVPPASLAASTAVATPPAPPDGGVTAELDRLEAEAAGFVRAVDGALWNHWTTGAPLDLAAAARGRDALLSREGLERVRRAGGATPDDARRRAHLERWVLGELLARGVADEAEAFATLEAGATFTLDGRQLPWRELGRLLVSERSAVKRRALWAASHDAAARLDAALRRLEDREREVLAGLGAPSPLGFAAALRELDLAALARDAEALLVDTEEEWLSTLESLSGADLKLPVKALTRADVPRLLKVPAAVDAQLPKAAVAGQLGRTLEALGFGPAQGLVLDLGDAPRKNPLPLVAAPVAGEVRVAARPAGGLRDLQALLAEVGAAVALAGAHTGHFATERLGDPAFAQSVGELFSQLPSDPDWLAFVGIPAAARPQVAAAARAQRLFALRRAAGVVLSRLDTEASDDEADARQRHLAITARALGLAVAPADGVRRRLDTADFLRAATTLQAARAAQRLRAALADGWWADAGAAGTLRARLARGTAVPVREP